MAQEKVWTGNYLKVWIGNFLIYFSFMLIVPLLPLYLSETFGADKETIGLALSGYTVMALLVRPFSGFLVDTYPRKTVLLVCMFFFFAIFGGYLVAGSLTLFTIFRTVHGAPFGAATVSANTVAIDVLSPKRRAEGIGYWGLSNNLANVLGPVAAIYLLQAFSGNFKALLWFSFLSSFIGLVVDSTIKLPKKEIAAPERKALSLDRFFLLKGWPQAITMMCFAFSYGVISTYVAIYGKEELGITSGTGLFFTFLAVGLIVSRLTGAKGLRNNQVARNASVGICISVVGYFLFALCHNFVGYYIAPFVIGLGNGHMYPAVQTMFINLAENNKRGTANSTVLTAWDAGVGLGVLAGGFLAERTGYHSAFWCAWIINVLGVLHFFLHSRTHFEKNKLR